MEKKYWDKFYQNPDENILGSSHFAVFVENHLKPNSTVLDLGCGNARDSSFFAKNGHNVTAVDTSIINSKNGSLLTIKDDVINFLKNNTNNYDVIYIRWFLHALPIETQKELLKLVSNRIALNGSIYIENRSINDKVLIKNSIYNKEDGSYTTSHKRWPTSLKQLEDMLVTNNFKIIYSEENYGFSPSGSRDYNTDPLLNRLIAKK